MKNVFFVCFSLIFASANFAQDNIQNLLAAGINDAKRFTADYISPASEGLAYGMNNGWFNHGKALKRFGFEVSIIANASFIKDNHKTFNLNTSSYDNIRFADNSVSKSVATALGQNSQDIRVILTYDDPIFGNQETEITLPTGIGSENINLIPTAFVQVSFSPFKGTQLKGRFFPKIKAEDAEIGLYGFGIQQEFTSWLPANKVLPVAISGLLAYTHLNGQYDFTEQGIVMGNDQKVETKVNTILAELIVSTRLKIINFYGGLGYLNGKSTTSLLGTFNVTDGVLVADTLTDPFSVEQSVSGIRGTVGANLKLGFFGLNLDYTLAQFDSATLGLNFSF